MQVHGVRSEARIDDAPAHRLALRVFQRLGVGIRLAIDSDNLEILVQRVGRQNQRANHEHAILRRSACFVPEKTGSSRINDERAS